MLTLYNLVFMYERQDLITGRPTAAGTQSKHEDIISSTVQQCPSTKLACQLHPLRRCPT